MLRTVSSGPSVERGTQTTIWSRNGSRERMAGTNGQPKSFPFQMKINPLVFNALTKANLLPGEQALFVGR
jgi:hypothetical protein